MGTYKQGILGPFSGKVGTVVGSNWRGVYYMRSLAPHVGNPKTPAQVAARERFAACSRALRPWQRFIEQSFIGVNGKKGWSGAIQANYPLVTESEGTYSLAFSDMELSNSDIVFPFSISLAESTLSISWTAPTNLDVFYGGVIFYMVRVSGVSDYSRIAEVSIDSSPVEITNSAFTTAGNRIELAVIAKSETDVSYCEKYTHGG